MLINWNDRLNLTSITNPKEIEERHFLDSMSCILATGNLDGRKLVDVGSGAGFPGLPLRIIYPGLTLTLVESTGKKSEFLREVSKALSLDDVQIVTERAETVGQQEKFRRQFDWAVARAVANLGTLVEYLLPLCKIGGYALAQKGPKAPAEVIEADKAITQLGGGAVQIIDASPSDQDQTRLLIVIPKVAPTPKGYPRRPGKPAKNPL
jgi:16S rRNA (guanine527-N7)-methyltransferase